jgi:hypothetical protein
MVQGEISGSHGDEYEGILYLVVQEIQTSISDVPISSVITMITHCPDDGYILLHPRRQSSSHLSP